MWEKLCFLVVANLKNWSFPANGNVSYYAVLMRFNTAETGTLLQSVYTGQAVYVITYQDLKPGSVFIYICLYHDCLGKYLDLFKIYSSPFCVVCNKNVAMDASHIQECETSQGGMSNTGEQESS